MADSLSQDISQDTGTYPGGTADEKLVWQCMNATKNGIANCPNCKAVDEVILEGAFLDAFGLLAGNFDDVLDVVLSYVAESADNDENMRKKQQIDKDISSL